MANNFLLKMRFIISESLRSSAVSCELFEGVVSLLEEFVAGFAFLGELSEKVTRAAVGVVFADFLRGILEVEFMEWVSEYLIVEKFWAINKLFWLFGICRKIFWVSRQI